MSKLPRPLTDRQKQALRRIHRADDGVACIAPDLARQLIRRGVVEKVRTYQRYEWQRPVATLWCCRLTVAGRNVMSLIEERA